MVNLKSLQRRSSKPPLMRWFYAPRPARASKLAGGCGRWAAEFSLVNRGFEHLIAGFDFEPGFRVVRWATVLVFSRAWRAK